MKMKRGRAKARSEMLEIARNDTEPRDAEPREGVTRAAGESPAPRGGPPRKLYKIGEVMQHSGLSRQTIHNYTMLGLITEEERTPSGHRLYGESVFYRLQRIQDLKQRMSLKEVRDTLERGEE